MAKQINLLIDGKPIKAKQGQRLIDVLNQNKFFVPSLCYFDHIEPPLGTCRVCTVKINGRPDAACTTLVKEGMEVEINSPELTDLRKSIVEMFFVEGNHFCPSCEKSGDCDLQHMGYELGIASARFPHLFKDKIIDFNPKRMVLEHNRCVLCRRCVEEVLTDEGKRVFSFHQRGNDTRVAIDYEQEAKLTEKQAVRAMHICPVGAILVKGTSVTRPFGERRFDLEAKGQHYKSHPAKGVSSKQKPERKIIATTSLAGCFGCHMSMLDIDLGILDLVELVSFDKSPLTDIKNFSRRCDVGIIEGGCGNNENVEVLRAFREKCDTLIAIGECAIWGGLPAMRNTVPLQDCLEEAYLHSMTSETDNELIPYHEDIPKILDKVYGCNEIVKIDYYIPGCPPNANHIWKVVKNLLFGEDFSVLYSEFKYD